MGHTIIKSGTFWGVFLLLLVFAGCRSTRYVPEGEHLLTSVRINNKARAVKRDELKPFVRQHENLTILGFWKLYLGLYNLSGRDDTKGFNKWLRRIGEEPVIFDPFLMDQSSQQLSLFLANKGYFRAEVEDTVVFRSNKKAKVTYTIKSGPRYRLNRVDIMVKDDSLVTVVNRDTIHTLLKAGRPFTVELHDRERQRITKALRNRGYFSFSEEYIYFLSDSTVGRYRVNDSLFVIPPVQEPGTTDSAHHQQYRIRKVLFHVGLGTSDFLMDDPAGTSDLDTLDFQDCIIIHQGKLPFKPSLLTNSNYIVPGDLFNAALVERTHQLLSSLRLFKYINVRFREIEGEQSPAGEKLLDCVIRLSPGKYQSYSVDLEGTNSSGNLGAAGSFTYQHKNFFKGGELFSLNTRLARENQFLSSSQTAFNTLESSAEASIVVPKFWIPFRIERFRQRYNPKTTLSLAYNYQYRPDYTRTIANARMGYTWRSSRYVTHWLYPIEFNLVNIPKVEDSFWERIEDSFLRYSYEDHLILDMSYSFLFNQQTLGENTDFWYLRASVESAGNLLDLTSPLWSKGGRKPYDEVLGIRFAQYVKTDLDLRFHRQLDRNSAMVYRFFGGIGVPYGNLKVLPFEKRYFSGGANSVRAWPVRGLGPGSYNDDTLRFYNQTADLKLEFNMEYRFKLFWLLEGALFLDVGNIWGLREETTPEGGVFRFNSFVRQLAVGTGFGTRFNFKYFIFRVDMGIKTYDPSQDAGNRWVPLNGGLSWSDVGFNFAIGYPF